MVRQSAAKRPLPGFARAGLLAAALLPGRMAMQLAAPLPSSVPAIGDLPRPRGEARPLPPSRCPAGTGKRCRMRGGLVGAIPEALCGEAPKGQPVIYRESLVTVRVEDPEGHPMIHGCPRPHKPRTSGKQKERMEESGPLSSRWTKAGKKSVGAALPHGCMEGGMLFGEGRRHQSLPRKGRTTEGGPSREAG